MDFVKFLFAWANAPFTFAFGVAALFALVQQTGLLGLFAHDDADVGDAAADADTDGDGDHDADHDDGVLTILGAGKVPLSVIWQTYAIVFGIVGISLNARYFGGAVPLYSLLWTVPTALLVGFVCDALLARVLGRLFSTVGTEATSRAELVGHIGVVISTRVSPEFGEIRIKDKTGHALRIVCRLAEGAHEVKETEEVVVVEYDVARGVLVAPLG